MANKDYRRQRQNKYHNKRVQTPYGRFDSQKEYKRFLVLKDMQERGEISGLELQPSFLLIPKQTDKNGKVVERATRYRADFAYLDKTGRYVVEDVKGERTTAYIMKRKLMLERHGIRIKEV